MPKRGMHLFNSDMFFDLWCRRGCRLILTVLILLITAGSTQAQEIEVINDLLFPTTLASYAKDIVTISPSSMEAAVFEIRGEPNQSVNIRVVPSRKVYLEQEGTQNRVKVYDFTFGGSVPKQVNSVTAVLDANGRLTNLRLGATVDVLHNTDSGTYRETLHLEVEYD